MPTGRMLYNHERDTVDVLAPTFATPLNIDAGPLTDNILVNLTLTGNITLNVPTNGRTGQRITYNLTSDGSARTVSLQAGFKASALLNIAAAGIGVIAATKTRFLTFMFDGTSWIKVAEDQAA